MKYRDMVAVSTEDLAAEIRFADDALRQAVPVQDIKISIALSRLTSTAPDQCCRILHDARDVVNKCFRDLK